MKSVKNAKNQLLAICLIAMFLTSCAPTGGLIRPIETNCIPCHILSEGVVQADATIQEMRWMLLTNKTIGAYCEKK